MLKSVGSKIIAIVVSAIVVLSALFIIANIISLKRTVTKEFEGRIVLMGQNLASTVTEQLNTYLILEKEVDVAYSSKNLLDPIKAMLISTVNRDDVVYAVLLRKDGASIIGASRTQPQEDDEFSLPESEATTTVYMKRFPLRQAVLNKSKVYEIRVPVSKDADVIGEVALGFSDARLNKTVGDSVVLPVVISLAGVVLITLLIGWYIRRLVSYPLGRVTDVAMQIGEGVLSQKEIQIVRNDEIGQLAAVFNKMLRQLGGLVDRAEMIANGMVGVNEVEQRLNSGSSLEAATVTAGANNQGDLANAFDRMQSELQKLAVQARRIAADDLNNQILDLKISGEIGEAFSQMTGNLKELANVAQQIANHDLTMQVTVRSDRDILAKAFAKMASNLKALIASINQLANETHHSAGEMADTTGRSNQAMGNVQNSIQQIASATIQVSRSAQEISMLVQNANKVVEAGSGNIAKVISKFEALTNTISTTGESIRKLEQRSREISEIVGLITKIADQTNLLSLNAAIEAARAGEAGHGFAVVADEVRKLAESSGKSAENISKIIKEIQQDTASVVTSSQTSLDEAKEVLDLAERMREGYSAIVDAIQGMSQQVEHIAAISQENAASSEEISASVQEQTAAIEEVSGQARKLVLSAAKLKTEIGRFKV